MASLNQHHSNSYNRVFSSFMFSENQRRGSTSQMCLHKILRIITTVPPPLGAARPPFSVSETKESSPENITRDENKGSSVFDLSPEPKESFVEDDAFGVSLISNTAVEGGGSSAAAGGGFFGINTENGCDRVENEEHDEDGGPRNSHIEKIKEEDKILILLIEAAKLIFGEFEDNDKAESEVKKDEATTADIAANDRKLRRRSSGWTAGGLGGAFDGTASSGVVRSKRGRTQVLPCKYRDSVLEPLTRFSRPAASSILPSKRRRR